MGDKRRETGGRPETRGLGGRRGTCAAGGGCQGGAKLKGLNTVEIKIKKNIWGGGEEGGASARWERRRGSAQDGHPLGIIRGEGGHEVKRGGGPRVRLGWAR